MSEDTPFAAEAPGPRHYYGDIVRILFVINALLILGAQILGVAFLTPTVALGAAVILVIAAGLTNPVQSWIHWVNALVATAGLVIASNFVLTRYGEGELLTKGALVVLVAGIFLFALYSTIKTLRGVLMRNAPEIE